MDADVLAPRVIPSVLEPDAEAADACLEALPGRFTRVELRADHLDAGGIERLVRRHGNRLIVALRREEDGGGYRGSETVRCEALRRALAAGAGFVDLERGSAAATLLGEPGCAERAILSDHGARCRSDRLGELYAEMAASPAAVLKIVPRANGPAEIVAVHDLLRRAAGDERRLACFALGRAGALSRLMAPAWGSWATYGAARRGAETAEGQYAAEDLVGAYAVEEMGRETERFALIGSRVNGSPSPAMHQAGYRLLGLDACYLPVELDSLEDWFSLLAREAAFGFRGFAVTMPFKEEAARHCCRLDTLAASCGAVNSVRIEADGWHGFNTDGPAALALIRRRLVLGGLRAAILGAGGTATALAAALASAGAEVVLFNRDTERAAVAARRLGVRSAAATDLGDHAWDLLVNATPQGADGERFLDPGRLTGRMVLDVVYRRGPTALARDARRRGLEVVEGFELLAAQAALQFERLTGRPVPVTEIAAVGMQWLNGLPA